VNFHQDADRQRVGLETAANGMKSGGSLPNQAKINSCHSRAGAPRSPKNLPPSAKPNSDR
jgi:hypothetical protein